MRFAATIFQDEDGWFVVECPVIPGCLSQGRTEADALENIKDAIALSLETRRSLGLSPFIESREVEVAVGALGFHGSLSARRSRRSSARAGAWTGSRGAT